MSRDKEGRESRYICPSCGLAARPFVMASRYVQINNDSEVINESPDEYDGGYLFSATSAAICNLCGHRATLAYFRYGQDPKKLLSTMWLPYRLELEDSVRAIAEASIGQKVIGISNLSVRRFGDDVTCTCCNVKLTEGIGAQVKTVDDEVHAVAICRNRNECLSRRGAMASIDGGHGLYEATLSIRIDGSEIPPEFNSLLMYIGAEDIQERCRFLGDPPAEEEESGSA